MIEGNIIKCDCCGEAIMFSFSALPEINKSVYCIKCAAAIAQFPNKYDRLSTRFSHVKTKLHPAQFETHNCTEGSSFMFLRTDIFEKYPEN